MTDTAGRNRKDADRQEQLSKASAPGMLHVGCAKVDITPQSPLPLAGFSHRQGDFERIESPLFARILIIQQEADGKSEPLPSGKRYDRALIVSADLLWWDGERIAGLKQTMRERWGFDEAQVLFHATHNHSGPQTSGAFTASLGKPDDGYIAFLEERILAGVEQAAASLEAVTVERGSGRCDIGVNRRKAADGCILMAPNPEGPTDPEVTLIRFAALDGRPKAVLVHYACHPTTSGENTVSSEFTGYAMERLEERLGGGAVAAYLQGCCADVRPALVRDGNFYRGGEDDVRTIGQTLANEALDILARPMKRLAPGSFAARTVYVQLPLQEPPTAEELAAMAGNGQSTKQLPVEEKGSPAGAGRLKQLAPDAGILEQWSKFLLSDRQRLRRTIQFELTCFELAEGFTIVAANAEMAAAYGLFVKDRFGGTVLPVCYTNGMIGYIPTAAQVDEGGYEAVDFIYYFGLPAPFAPEAEHRIRESMAHLVGQTGKPDNN